MNLLYWQDNYAPQVGGIESLTSSMVDALAERGHRITVIAAQALTQDFPVKSTPHPRITIHRLPMLQALLSQEPREILQVQKAVAQIKQQTDFDVVHLHLQASTSFFHMVTKPWKPMLVTIHATFGKHEIESDSLLYRVLQRAAKITTVSKALREDLLSRRPAFKDRTEVIYNAIPVPIDKPESMKKRLSRASIPTVFCGARHVKDKGLDLLLKAWPLILAEVPKARLVVAGDGPDRAMLEALGQYPSISFPGWLSGEAYRSALKQAWVVVVPSRVSPPEGFGLTALDAMQAARAVVASRSGGLTEVITPSENGLLVTPKPQEIAAAIIDLLKHPTQAFKMGERGAIMAETRFKFDPMILAYERCYQAIQK
ncbi:glycosyltransferase family 4 protein [Magnetococcales bacterium HHB-1]